MDCPCRPCSRKGLLDSLQNLSDWSQLSRVVSRTSKSKSCYIYVSFKYYDSPSLPTLHLSHHCRNPFAPLANGISVSRNLIAPMSCSRSNGLTQNPKYTPAVPLEWAPTNIFLLNDCILVSRSTDHQIAIIDHIVSWPAGAAPQRPCPWTSVVFAT